MPRFPPCLCQWLDHKAAVLLACYLPSQPIASILSFNYQVPLIPVLWPTVYNMKIAFSSQLELAMIRVDMRPHQHKNGFYLRCWEKLTMVCLKKDTVSKTSICTKDGQVRLTGCVPHSLLMQPRAAFVIPARDGSGSFSVGQSQAVQGRLKRRWRQATPQFTSIQCNPTF